MMTFTRKVFLNIPDMMKLQTASRVFDRQLAVHLARYSKLGEHRRITENDQVAFAAVNRDLVLVFSAGTVSSNMTRACH